MYVQYVVRYVFEGDCWNGWTVRRRSCVLFARAFKGFCQKKNVEGCFWNVTQDKCRPQSILRTDAHRHTHVHTHTHTVITTSDTHTHVHTHTVILIHTHALYMGKLLRDHSCHFSVKASFCCFCLFWKEGYILVLFVASRWFWIWTSRCPVSPTSETRLCFRYIQRIPILCLGSEGQTNQQHRTFFLKTSSDQSI